MAKPYFNPTRHPEKFRELPPTLNYTDALYFLRHLRKCDKYITREEHDSLRSQALEGDIRGAEKRLDQLVNMNG